MNGIKLRGTGRCVPANTVTNDDLSRLVDTNDEWITARTGIRSRYRCEKETLTELCVSAARDALHMAGITPADIGVCIVATVSADTVVPSAACLLQRALGLPEDTPCFDLNAACTGFVYALHTMECLLNASPRKFGLVVGAEALSKVVDWTDRGTCILFGDGAAAAVVAEMVEREYVNDARYAETRAHGLLAAKKSRRAAAQNLRQKGLSASQIEQALDTVYALSLIHI